MSMTNPFEQKSLRLSGIRNVVSASRWHHLYDGLFAMARGANDSSAINVAVQPQQCPECETRLDATNELYSRIAVCDHCGYHFPLSASQRVSHLTDEGSFKLMEHGMRPLDFLGFGDEQSYATKLLAEQKKTGLNDAVLVGRCRIGGTETMLAVLDFHFMGGSMGSVVGEQITFAFEYATRHHLPVVTVVNSGGARMQEGIISLMQMPKTAAAFEHFHMAGLLYLSVLASPTTGGVFASFASLGDVLLAEPKAVIGFAGPRVAELVTGRKLLPGSHRAEMLLASGQLDTITARRDLPSVLATLLRATAVHSKQQHSHSDHENEPLVLSDGAAKNSAWECVALARHPDRPTARDYIRYLSLDFLELQGDRCYGDDPTVLAGLGSIGGHPIVFVGQVRNRNKEESQAEERQTRIQPEGFRKAMRMMNLAAQLHCPLVTFVDTSGADPGDDSERHGLAWSLAHCLSLMSSLPVPIVTAIIGEGASGGAVAFAVADHIMMLQNAIYEVIAPEGAATILYRDAHKATQVAEQLNLTAPDCLRLGVIDAIIPEPLAGAHTNPTLVMQALERHLLQVLPELEQLSTKQLLARRYRKFRQFGQFQRRPHTLLSTSVATIKQGQSVWNVLRNWFPLAHTLGGSMAIISEASTQVQALTLRQTHAVKTVLEGRWWHHA